MKPEIERYLREHGDRYTTEALRRSLLDAGHDPSEVDSALREWQAGRGGAGTAVSRSRFWRWAIGLHAAVFVVMVVWFFALGAFEFGFGQISLVVLAIVLLIGLGISGLIGRALLPGSGLVVALIVPAVSALLIGGTCVAFSGAA